MEVAMATRNVSKQASALAKARERRRALDKARDDQDQRIEEATAAALVALEIRGEAEWALEAATGQVGEALKVLTIPGGSSKSTYRMDRSRCGISSALVHCSTAIELARSLSPAAGKPGPALRPVRRDRSAQRTC